jgi:hypothetical protein
MGWVIAGSITWIVRTRSIESWNHRPKYRSQMQREVPLSSGYNRLVRRYNVSLDLQLDLLDMRLRARSNREAPGAPLPPACPDGFSRHK